MGNTSHWVLHGKELPPEQSTERMGILYQRPFDSFKTIIATYYLQGETEHGTPWAAERFNSIMDMVDSTADNIAAYFEEASMSEVAANPETVIAAIPMTLSEELVEMLVEAQANSFEAEGKPKQARTMRLLHEYLRQKKRANGAGDP